MTTFLEAHRTVANFAGGPPLPFLLAMSGTADPLDLYLKAAGARRGRSVAVRHLPFNTFGQFLTSARGEDAQVLLVCPWDLVPETDWRSGIPLNAPGLDAVRQTAADAMSRMARRGAPMLYLAAPLPPLWSDPSQTALLADWLAVEMRAAGARALPSTWFSLGTYLGSGCPIGGTHLGDVAEAVIDVLLPVPLASAKVLITDLDNTLWSGIIGDDGVDGIHFGPDGKGFPHFVLQTLLRRLSREGVLLAAVTKNDFDVAVAPLRAGRMTLVESDFVAILASWHAKSAQIRELAQRLNLGLDAFVFLDDNPVELAEVGQELPTVRCVQFPSGAQQLPAVLDVLQTAFATRDITDEDRQRTTLYRRRLEGMVPTDAGGSDLTEFLQRLEMSLTMHDRSHGDRTRAVQLINKTNQFNMNGVRLPDDEVARCLAAGGRLYSATLEDRTGSHGEILACLIDADGVIQSMVMSCRVFQRRVEQAFLFWLASREMPLTAVNFASTDRNEPARTFLRSCIGGDPADGDPADGIVTLDAARIAAQGREALALFRIEADHVAA